MDNYTCTSSILNCYHDNETVEIQTDSQSTCRAVQFVKFGSKVILGCKMLEYLAEFGSFTWRCTKQL